MSTRLLRRNRRSAGAPEAGPDGPTQDQARTPPPGDGRGLPTARVASTLRVLAVVAAGFATALGISTAYSHLLATEPSGLAPDGQELVRLINLARTRQSCPVLHVDPRLNAAAQAQADDMVVRGFTSDVNPDNEDALIRAQRQGYPGNVAENFAVGLAEPEEVVTQWTNTTNLFARESGKRLLNCGLVSVGVGHDTGVVRPPLAGHVWVVTLGDR